MATITTSLQLLDCLQPERVKLERVSYFPRQLLTADDMITDQDYFRQKLRRHNRFLHGWGTVCGLVVTAAPTEDAPWRVQIGSGYALGPYGDEIYVADYHYLDLARCGPGASTNPCEPDVISNATDAAGPQIYVAIKYAECFASPVRAMPAGCGCDDSACEYSRIRDSFEICCLRELPPSHNQPLICDLISQGELTPCPPCPEDPWVVLAQVNLPAAAGTEVTNDMINNIAVRRQIYSTAMLQEQLIRCCCGEQTRQVADLQITQNVVEVSDRTGKYTITVTNNGPSTAHKVVVEDVVSGGAIIKALGFDPPGLWSEQSPPGPFVANLGDLNAEQSVTISFDLQVDAGTYLSTSTVSSETLDPITANNTATTTHSYIKVAQ